MNYTEIFSYPGVIGRIEDADGSTVVVNVTNRGAVELYPDEASTVTVSEATMTELRRLLDLSNGLKETDKR